MGVVVGQDVPDSLVDHWEQWAEGSEASEVHDVVQADGVL